MSQNPDQVTAVKFSEHDVLIYLADGLIIGNPLDWHPWLRDATTEQRTNVEHYERSVYFPDLDDGLDVDEMLKGEPPRLHLKMNL